MLAGQRRLGRRSQSQTDALVAGSDHYFMTTLQDGARVAGTRFGAWGHMGRLPTGNGGETLLRTKPAEVWLKLSALSAFLAFMVFFQGLAASGLDVGEKCGQAGQAYDHEYRSQNAHEQLQLFPLTAKCDAEYDLVPAWTNPALAVLAILTVAFFGAMLAPLFMRLKHLAIKDA